MQIPIHFLLMSFFAFSALFASSVSSLLVFIGALIGLVFPILLESYTEGVDETKLLQCYGTPIFGSTLNRTPFSIFIYAYLLMYFIYVFSANSLWKSVNNTFAFLGLLGLLGYDTYRVAKVCEIPIKLVFISLFIGLVWGLIWPAIIGKPNHYKPGISSSEKCELNKDGSVSTKYQCKLRTDGELIR